MNQDAIWDYFQTVETSVFEESYARLQYLAGLIQPNKKVLNIGVGDGSFEQLALQRSIDIYSLDPSRQTIENIRTKLKLAQKAQLGRAEEIPFSENSFDCVILSEVVEHLNPELTQKALTEVKRVLKSGGFIIGTVPRNEDLAASIVICPDCKKIFHRWGHLQSFSKTSLEQLLSLYFSKVHVYDKKFVPWRKRSLIFKLSAIAKLSFRSLGFHCAYENLVFKAQK